MNFTQRENDILKYMLKVGRPVQSAEIADKLGISARTIQREMPNIADDVKRYGMLLIRNKRQGNYLSGTPTAKELLKSDLSYSNEIDPANKEVRRRYLLFNLLREREPRKLFYYSNMLGVSETTVAADIEALLGWLSKNNLTVIKKQGYGVVLSGREKDYREAMRRFIQENISRGDETELGYDDEILSSILMNSTDEGIYSFLDRDTLERVDMALDSMEDSRLSSLAKQAYAGLVTHIAIVIERIRQGGFLEVTPESMEDLKGWEDYDLALRIINEIEKEFEIAIPEEEISYILLHLQGSKVAYSSDTDSEGVFGVDDERLLNIVDEMVNIYNPTLAPQLISDEDFVRGLLVHLRPVFVRLKENMNIYNPLLSDIKDEYADIYKRCEDAAKVIENAIGVKVSDEEIGFLAMHFGAAEERALSLSSPIRRVTIGIVCASGFGVARLMMTKLERELSERAVLKAYGKEELDSAAIEETDFFVSTLNLDEYGVDYLSVSPLISAKDLAAIGHKMNDYSHIRKRGEDTDFFGRLKKTECISRDVRLLIEGYRSYEVSAKVKFAELLLFLGLKTTKSTMKAHTVVDDVTEREKMYTQLFPEMGFGLLHCRTTAVDDVVFVSCKANGNDGFIDAYFKGIKTAIMMLSPRDEFKREHADVLGVISAALIDNDGFLPALHKGNEDEVRVILAEILKEFYLKFIREV